MLKRLLGALFAALISIQASAAGPNDGIYNIGGTQEYFSVHQNANFLIVGYFTTIPASNVSYILGDGQSFAPTRLDYWELLSGNMTSSNSASVSGEIAYGACRTTVRVTFVNGGMDVTQLSMGTTDLGSSSRINCPGYQNFLVSRRGLTQFWTKVY